MNRMHVTVVIPTYNRADTIERAVRSVLAQTYTNLDVVVVDDASKDSTKEVVEAIDDSRVSYYCLEKNSGACVARNTGVEKASGEIIAFQDSDDCWHENKLEKQINYLVKNRFDFISCGFNKMVGNDCIPAGLHECSNNMTQVWCELLNNNWISTQTIVCYKYCFEKIRFDSEIKRYQDWDLSLQIARYFNIGSLNECLVDVYLQANSITNAVKSEQAKLAVVMKQKRNIDLSNKDVVAQYYKTLADVTRKRMPIYAAKYYRKSIMLKPNFKKIVCWFACVIGFFKLYNARQ